MKRFITVTILSLILGLSGQSTPVQAQPSTKSIDYTDWEQILNTYVSDAGLVDYKGIKANRAALDTFIRKNIESADISQLSKDEQMAFWINSYNALTVRLIVDHYPLKFGGIRTINWGRPWSIKMKVAGQQLTLGDIEHEILRKWDPIDPRIHFAINCASGGCPKIINTHYNPDTLDKQLDQVTREFANNAQKNRLDRKKNILYHSAIFSWFEEDFLATHSGILDYIVDYINPEDRDYLKKKAQRIKLKELKYDWGLNQQK